MPARDPYRVPVRLRGRVEAIVAFTHSFCIQHLNDEYDELCRRMAAALARKRPSPLERGEVRTWAAAILHAAGWVNFLADSSEKPHMSAAELAQKAGVGQSTIAARFREIRDALDLTRLHPAWTRPSRLLDGPAPAPAARSDQPAATTQPAAHSRRRATAAEDGPRRRTTPGRTKPAAEKSAGRVYQLSITLAGIRPRIWRRILVPEDTTLERLHRILQAAMGWEDDLLWEFEIGGVDYGEKAEPDWEAPVESAGRARLHDVAEPGDVFVYLYDFGDSWRHEVEVEEVLPAEPGRQYPVCLAAKRACPPENCGGVPGYEELLEVLADPAHDEHEHLLEWLGGGYDPEAVDLDAINRRLAGVGPRARRRRGGRGSRDRQASDAQGPSTIYAVESEAVEEGTSLLRIVESAIREGRSGLEQILGQALGENPDATIEELIAAFEAAMGGYDLRPRPDLGGLSPKDVERLLDPDWERPESAVRLNGSLSLDDLQQSTTLHNARLFLSLLTERADVKATPSGNLPRSFVASFRERMRWPSTMKSWYPRDKARNEAGVAPLHRVRVLLDLAGLIKRRKGTFSATRRGEQLAAAERAGELFATLFRTHFRVFNLAYLDGMGPALGFQYTIALALYRFSRVAAAWRLAGELANELILDAVRAEVAESSYDFPVLLLTTRFLYPLEQFALAEIRELSQAPPSSMTGFAVRKSPLFDRFLTFDLPTAGRPGPLLNGNGRRYEQLRLS